MVCVSPSPLSPRLVRAARRQADRRQAAWLAVYVETPRHYRLAEADRERVAQTLHLAEQLGGEAVVIAGQDVPEELIRYAQSRNVTEIILGKSLRSRWSEVWRGSLVYEVVRQSGHIDVYVITGEDTPSPHLLGPVLRHRPAIHPYLWSAAAVAVAGGGCENPRAVPVAA